jgi:phage gpG-like protein
VKVAIRVAGTNEAIVRRDLLRFGENLTHLRDGFEDVGDIMREAVRQQFATEGRHASGGWPELADSTKANRARELGLSVRGGALRDDRGRFASAGHPILRVHDDLYNSLVSKYDKRHVERPSDDSLLFGTTVPHAVFHQSTEPRTKIPYRPPVALSQGDKRQITKALQTATLRGVRR